MMKGPEAIIEDDNAEYAEGLGLLTLKLRLLGVVGWPDRLFLAPFGRVLFIEYKAPGKKPRPAQVRVHNNLKRYGFHVYTIDDIATGRELLRRFTEGEALPNPAQDLKRWYYGLSVHQDVGRGRPTKTASRCPKHTTGGGPCYCGTKPR